jgi:bacterioferritin-associated ferredoxin
MYVCICKGVTENVIREAVEQGAERMRDLKDCLGVTEQCGICACHAKQVMNRRWNRKRSLNNKKHLHSILLPSLPNCAKISVCEDENVRRLNFLLEKSLKATAVEPLPVSIIFI